MAIATMKKMTLIALKKDRNAILKALQRTGTVQIIESGFDDLSPCADAGQVSALEQKLSEVKNAIAFINKYDKSKNSMLKAKPAITPEGLSELARDEEKALAFVKQAKSVEERLMTLRSQKARILNRTNAVKPYLSLDAPLESVQDTPCTKTYLGVIGAAFSSFPEETAQRFGGLVHVEVLAVMPDYISIFAVAHNGVAEEFHNSLKAAYFAEFSYSGLTGTPRDVVARLEAQAADQDAQAAKVEEEAKRLAAGKQALKGLEDYYATELERARAAEHLSATEKTFVLAGWVIAGCEQKAREAVDHETGQYYMDFRDSQEDEAVPVALVNSRLLRPYEAVIEMYSLPDAKGVDATALIAPFYFIFYGMMVSDAGYGIVLTLFALLLLKLMKPAGMFRKILGIITMTGVSTLIWGALYGGWFGFSLQPLWFNPMEQPMTMLLLCLGLGFFHVLTGLVAGAVILFRKGRWADALCDKIIWIIFIVGLPMLALGGTLSAVGSYMAIAGVAGIVLTNGRAKKGIFKKLMGGLSALYGSTGYLSDVLSYSRLFGMGLATGVIAMVFNKIAELMIGQWYGYIFAAVIFLVGHTFNIGINALGAYVHSCRLMYIEYFSKFYEDGGSAFKPLALRIKNYRLENH